jgi:hypothetical protein
MKRAAEFSAALLFLKWLSHPLPSLLPCLAAEGSGFA